MSVKRQETSVEVCASFADRCGTCMAFSETLVERYRNTVEYYRTFVEHYGDFVEHPKHGNLLQKTLKKGG
jgi:hypothetical protein